MNMPRKVRRSWATGEHGVNRVRLCVHPKSGVLRLKWYEERAGDKPRVITASLGHTDWNRGKGEAEAHAQRLRTRVAVADDKPITLGDLLEIYLEKKTPTKGRSAQSHDRRAASLFLKHWGPETIAEQLHLGHWDSYLRARSSGALAPEGGRPGAVRARVLEQDMTFIRAVCNWATFTNRAGQQRPMLPRNPFARLPVPREKNVARPIVSDAQSARLLEVAATISPRFELALVLVSETGHRLNSVRQLRWMDLDFERRVIRWPAQFDKMGFAHETPLVQRAIDALRAEEARQIGEVGSREELRLGWVFPSSRSDEPLGRRYFYRWWAQAAKKCGGTLDPRTGFHSFRRKFATDLLEEPLKVVMEAGGWRSQVVVSKLYQQPGVERQREALERRRKESPIPENFATLVATPKD